jgi:hypothetical protein
LEGAQVQFWHTDENGNYKHPGFNTRGLALLSNFQYFGTATTANDGSFQFKTYRPGIYSARPIAHIHYKVWWNGSDVLTSQFYFADEGTTQPLLLQLDLLEQEDGSLHTNKTITLNMGLGGSEPITPSQVEGPFYPVVDFFHMDSDMTVLTPDEQGTLNHGLPLATSNTSVVSHQSPTYSPTFVDTSPSATKAATGNTSSSPTTQVNQVNESASSTRHNGVLLGGVAFIAQLLLLVVEVLPAMT